MIAMAALALSIAVTGCKRAEPVPPPRTSPTLSGQGKYRLALELSEGFSFPPAEKAEAIYVISNLRQCTPKDHSRALGGIWNLVDHRLNADLLPAGANGYVVEVPVNPLRDEDYYGLGVCHWALSGVTFSFDSFRRITVNQRHLERRAAEFICATYPDSPVGNCFESGTTAVQPEVKYQAAKVTINKE